MNDIERAMYPTEIRRHIKALVATMDKELAEAIRDKGVDWVIIALREKQEREVPQPLTPEQLKQRAERCEHIYVARTDGQNLFREQKCVACVLDVVEVQGYYQYDIQAIYGRNLSLSESDYGKTWLAYAQKIEGGGEVGDGG